MSLPRRLGESGLVIAEYLEALAAPGAAWEEAAGHSGPEARGVFAGPYLAPSRGGDVAYFFVVELAEPDIAVRRDDHDFLRGLTAPPDFQAPVVPLIQKGGG